MNLNIQSKKPGFEISVLKVPVKQYEFNKIATVIKHIPGHGRADVDSHKALPCVEADIDTLVTSDFVPFKDMNFSKLYVYAFDLRPHLYSALEAISYFLDARLKDHCFFNNEFKDVVIYSKLDE